jgi:hypothetical protein
MGIACDMAMLQWAISTMLPNAANLRKGYGRRNAVQQALPVVRDYPCER